MERRREILSWIKDILDKHLAGISFRAFVFGSQANCIKLKRADIDIGIIPEFTISDFRFAGIYADIENLPMLYSVDLVDFGKVEDSFRTVALKNIEIL